MSLNSAPFWLRHNLCVKVARKGYWNMIADKHYKKWQAMQLTTASCLSSS